MEMEYEFNDGQAQLRVLSDLVDNLILEARRKESTNNECNNDCFEKIAEILKPGCTKNQQSNLNPKDTKKQGDKQEFCELYSSKVAEAAKEPEEYSPQDIWGSILEDKDSDTNRRNTSNLEVEVGDEDSKFQIRRDESGIVYIKGCLGVNGEAKITVGDRTVTIKDSKITFE